MSDRSRRDFLHVAGAGFVLAASGCHSGSNGSKPLASVVVGTGAPAGPVDSAPKVGDFTLPAGGVIPRRKLGRTGLEVSMLGIGGYHIGTQPEEADSIRIVREAIDHGVTFLDNCWDYNKGVSEERMGKALRDGYRPRVVLMTKLDGRTATAVTSQLEQSLRRLGTDVIDVVQIHEVIRDTDPERVFGPGGAIEALTKAQQQGKLRFIGFTGHKSPAIHRKMLATAEAHGFRFDTVQMPLNVMDPHFESFELEVLPLMVQAEMGVLGMKSMGDKIILASGAASALECLHYSMSLPTSVVITGCDSLGVLQQALFAAMTWKPMPAADKAALLARTAKAGSDGRFEQFKTTGRFDGTAQNPKWLETAAV
jgi:diketogulonate reductase-like aldo/keto reductase